MKTPAASAPPPPRGPPWLSPTSFVVWAGVFALAYVACALAGMREDTTFLSGTVAGGRGWSSTQNGCAAYLLAYFGFVLVAPILLLAAALLALWLRLTRRVGRRSVPEDFTKLP